MQATIKKIETYLLQQTSWLFFIPLLLASYVLMPMTQKLGWIYFLGWMSSLVLLFAPTLLFVIFRKALQKRVSPTVYKLSWVNIFLVYPLGLWLLNIGIRDLSPFDYLYPPELLGTYLIPLLALSLVFVDIIIIPLSLRHAQRNLENWILGLSIPKLACILIAIFSALLIIFSNAFQAKIAAQNIDWNVILFLVYWIQTFIIYMSYYLFYHIHHHFLFNKLLKEKGLLVYLSGLLALLLILPPFYYEIIWFFPVVHELKIHIIGLIPQNFHDSHLIVPLAILLLSFPLIIIVEWYKKVNLMALLEKEKTSSELSLLKQQINPHFFFNTLNNLYAMSLTQEKETPETIMQLSDLMRYVIYKGKEDRVSLKDEIKYIRDYIELQKIRLHKKADIQFEVKLTDEQIQIPPLLFIILIENAFKHSIEPAEGDCYLHIHLDCSAQRLHFNCRNSKESVMEAKHQGIGLQNLRRRLEILYPQQHQLEIQDHADYYQATLSIEL